MHYVLASSNAILILSGFSESTGCIHKFALVPKEINSKIGHMVLLLLADRDSVLFQYPYSPHKGSVFENRNDDTELILKESLSVCPSEVSYDPNVHPNGFLDFQKNELISKCASTHSDDRKTTESKGKNKCLSEALNGKPQSIHLPLTPSANQRRKGSCRISSDTSGRKTTLSKTNSSVYNRHSMSSFQPVRDRTEQDETQNANLATDYFEVIEDFH